MGLSVKRQKQLVWTKAIVRDTSRRALETALRACVTTANRMGVAIANRVAMAKQLNAHDPLLSWMIFTGLTVFAFLLLCFFGLVQKMLLSDPTHISAIILVAYIAASLHCLWRIVALSREGDAAATAQRMVIAGDTTELPDGLIASHIRELKTKAALQGGGRIDQTLLLRVLAERLRGSNEFGTFASDTLMKLGLLGTIVGFIMMLAPMSLLDTGNSAAVKSSMSLMSEGMAVAMYTTLTGLIGSLLIKVQYYFVDAETERIFASAVALTEVHVVPAIERKLEAAA
jgi:MotA/TolQ/ExbB proton channel family